MIEAATARTASVNTTQCSFFYAESGRGPAVLLLHDGNGSHDEWSRFAPLLAGAMRVLVPDRPGCGLSGIPREGFGRTTQGRAIHEFIKAMGEERVAVVGHGMGAFLAIEFAAANSYAVSRMVLISPVSGGLDGPSRRLTSEEAVAERQLYGGESNGDRAARAAETLIEQPELRRWYVDSVAKHASESDPRVITEMLEAAGHVRDDILLPTFRQPTMIVRPANDPTFSVARASRIFDLIPNAQLVEMPEVGHFAHIEAPEKLAALVLPFLRER